MGSIRKWMLAAALVAGTVGLGAAPAHAARIGVGVYVGAPRAYAAPSPGPGYAWVAGYYAHGYWVPGFWRAPGPRAGIVVRGGYGYGWHGPVYGRHFGPERFRR
jgi:hypothetical protein